MKKSRDMKKLLLGLGIVLLLFICIFNALALRSFQKMSKEYYEALSALLDEIKEQYPEFDEEDWIRYLSEVNAKEQNEELSDQNSLLARYGYTKENFYVTSQKKQVEELVIISNILIVSTVLILGGFLYWYWKKRRTTIDELAEYIRKVEQGEYNIDLADNSEDELSQLKNELYTVTVMLKESAEISKKQKKALANSVSDISHQIKTPLTSVMVLLDNMTDDENMDPEIRKKFLLEVTRQCNHVSWLIASLLRLSKLDAGVVELHREEANLGDICRMIIEKLEILAEWKQVTVELVSEDVFVHVDQHWFQEALMNIVKNGIEHSFEGGKVTISFKENDVYTSIMIKDTGEGMDAEDCKHIFERFYKSKNASEQSIGIGLSLANEVVKQHNGTISVDSKAGEGTRFEIKLFRILKNDIL